MKCSHCESELAGDARFCSQCGQAMSGPNNSVSQSGERLLGSHSEQPQGVRARVYAGVASGGHDHAGGAGEAAQDDRTDEPDVVSGKVMTSPFPALPQTASALGLPDIGLNGAAVHALLAQANLCRMRRQWEEAVDCCVAVLRAQPANQSAHVLLGDIYRDQGRAEDAIQWYGMAVELRPNPTDHAKLDQVKREQERAARQASLRGRRGYDNAPPASLDAGTDPNRGTTNLMGVSPRRWLRGITTVSLAFLVFVLIGLIWTRMGGGVRTNTVKSAQPPTVAQRTGGTGLPPHRPDQTLPAHLLAQAANGDRSVLVGGGGLPPDHSLHSPTVAAAPRTNAFPGAALPGSAVPSRAPLGMTATPNLPTQPVQNLRPLPPPPAPQPTSAIGAVAPPSNRLTDGLELTQTLGDGGVSATVLLTGPSSLVLDGSPRAQEALVRNVYRAARTAFAGNTMLTRVRVLIQTQVQGTGLASIVEAEADRDTATSANPTRDDAASLRGRLLSYRWSGANVAPAQEAASEPRALGQ